MATVTLTDNHGLNYYRVTGLAANTFINADDATWIIDNATNDGDGTNLYPIRIYSSPGVVLDGGAMWGEVSQIADWRDIYVNSAGIRVESSPGAIIQDWRIDGAWDAIRIADGTQDFLIQNVWVTNTRDDAIENDPANSGTIRDSLFDGVFVGLSLDGDRYGGNDVITLDGVLMRMESYLYKGKITHGSYFKTDSGNFDSTPDLRLFNNVFAIENPNHESLARLQAAWDHVVASSNNYLLNLSDTPLPADYPKPPAGFTILQGQSARDYWVKVRDTWIAEHEGGTPPPPIDLLPHALDDTVLASRNTAVAKNVLGNDNQGDAPAVISAFDHVGTQGGTVVNSGNGNLTYTPPLSFTGIDTFTYTIADHDGDTSRATVAVTVANGVAQTIEKRVVSGRDDVEQRGSSVNLGSSDLELVKDGSTVQHVGLRFTDINIPQGAHVTKAYVQFTADETGSSPTALLIRGEDADDAAAFANTFHNVSARAMTDASASWAAAAWSKIGEANSIERTPDLSAVIEEIVGRDGWDAGNDLALIISGSGTRTAEAFESGDATAPLLHVEYTINDTDVTLLGVAPLL
jgi:hypothetical protein